MHVKIFRFDRRWRKVRNHLDARLCPICGASVHCNDGQAQHSIWHMQFDDVLDWAEQRMNQASNARPGQEIVPLTVADGYRGEDAVSDG